VHLYDVQDDVVYASDSQLVIHAPYTGQRTIHLPKPAAVYSLSEGRLLTAQQSTFRQFMKGRSTHYFMFGQPEAISVSVGQNFEDIKAASSRGGEGKEREREQQPKQRADVLSPPPHIDSMIAAAEDAPIPLDEDAPISLIIEEVVSLPDIEMLPEGLLSEAEVYDAAAAVFDPGMAEPPEVLPTTPSRRRRWNRRNRQQNHPPADKPTAAIEDLMSDLAPRRQKPPTAS
jgi:hypothetical protein